jgi:hypothetical protein
MTSGRPRGSVTSISTMPLVLLGVLQAEHRTWLVSSGNRKSSRPFTINTGTLTLGRNSGIDLRRHAFEGASDTITTHRMQVQPQPGAGPWQPKLLPRNPTCAVDVGRSQVIDGSARSWTAEDSSPSSVRLADQVVVVPRVPACLCAGTMTAVPNGRRNQNLEYRRNPSW